MLEVNGLGLAQMLTGLARPHLAIQLINGPGQARPKIEQTAYITVGI